MLHDMVIFWGKTLRVGLEKRKPLPKHYLALLSSISFLVILSKFYLFLY